MIEFEAQFDIVAPDDQNHTRDVPITIESPLVANRPIQQFRVCRPFLKTVHVILGSLSDQLRHW